MRARISLSLKPSSVGACGVRARGKGRPTDCRRLPPGRFRDRCSIFTARLLTPRKRTVVDDDVFGRQSGADAEFHHVRRPTARRHNPVHRWEPQTHLIWPRPPAKDLRGAARQDRLRFRLDG